jgi:hypothetical protein
MNASPSRLSATTLVLMSLTVCVAVAEDQTVPGPESKDVVSRVSGYVVHAKRGSELLAISLPTMKQTVVLMRDKNGADFFPTIHAISGPDDEGRIAFIEDHFFVASDEEKRHLLRTIRVDGKNNEVVFSRPGSAMWAATRAGRGEIGKHLAISHSGGKAAILTGLSERQMPGALLSEGNLEIWNVDEKSKLDVTSKAINEPMSWFPDGKRLAYVRLVSRDELEKGAAGLEQFGQYFGKLWDSVPAIYVLTIDTGETQFLHVGWMPIVSWDGHEVLVGGWDDRGKYSWVRVQMQPRKASPVQWPGGNAAGAIAVPAENVVMFTGLPTAGAVRDPKRPCAVKLAIMDSEKFCTLIPDFHLLDLISFGAANKMGGPR